MAMQLSSLSPLAVPYDGRLGRAYEESHDTLRSPFQRDRARIIHSQAFRRLQGKTQVFMSGAGDHYRTRLTHTLEVAQVARDIARTLHLNEDFTECLALAHDLGHPPFGHAGEAALNDWLTPHGLHFEHNEHGKRIITLLEEYSSHYPGLNLDLDIVQGILKHTPPFREEKALSHVLEVQGVNLSDEIAYVSHDCDDGLRAGIFSLAAITDLPLGAQAKTLAAERGGLLSRALIHLLVKDLITHSLAAIREQHLCTIEDVERSNAPVIRFSKSMRNHLTELAEFLRLHLYIHPTIVQSNDAGQNLIRSLCERYLHSPPEKILAIQHRTASSLPQAIADYVAGMTDSFAMQQDTANIHALPAIL